MASNDRGTGGDKTRGSGPDKETIAEPSGFDAEPGTFANESPDSNNPDPARGGCTKLGWGCLPVVAVVALLPVGLFT